MDISRKPQRPRTNLLSVKSALLALTFIACCPGLNPAQGQIVVPYAKKFTNAECKWLHSQFLDACMASETCGPYPDQYAYSMSTQRGVNSLEKVLTPSARNRIEAACERSCGLKTVVDYTEWQRSICSPLYTH